MLTPSSQRRHRARSLEQQPRCSRARLGTTPIFAAGSPHTDTTSQFGFDGSDIWETRRDTLFATLHANPLAKFVTRGVQFGSEPLYDNVLPHAQLAQQVTLAKQNLSSLNIPVTVSELAYGYQERGGAQDVLDAVDFINIHMLPFFSQEASIGASWADSLLAHGRVADIGLGSSERLVAACDDRPGLVHRAWRWQEDVP